ncbi:MAG TPA: glycosyltransferase family 4 protein [Bryobacteraceae bacterium]|jgi:glycosyltransferase involved in cell wall biosynthesis|nr:glycosyltransferase family 4 protein [Bryobacteraceae bacterium]
MDRIRVLLIAPSKEVLGGQSVQASRLMASLSERPELEMAFQPICPRIGFLGRIKFVRTMGYIVVFWTTLAVRAWRCDILHVFSASYWSYTLWTLPSLLFAKLYGKKIILNYRDGQAEDHLRNWRSALPTIRRMDRVVTNSGFLKDVFARFGVKAQCIFNVIDRDKFIYRKRGKLRPVFLHNRILEPIYNIECALRAFKLIQERYPEADLTVSHSGPSGPSLEKFANQLELRNTRFIGRVPHAKIAELYDQIDIYITTPNFDCMPGSILECFSSGLPVIATEAGGIPYIAANEVTALLVPRDDHQAVARSAFRLLEDQALVERLTANAWEEVLRYAVEPVRDQWTALYQELMKER